MPEQPTMRTVIALESLAEWFDERAIEDIAMADTMQVKREAAFHRGRGGAFRIAAEHLRRSLDDAGWENP